MKSDGSSNNARTIAYEILKSVIIHGKSLTQAFNVYPHIGAFAKALCFGTLRDYQRLSVITNRLVAKKPKKQALDILLIMGIFQLLSIDKPDYACVAETVSLAKADKMSWASGMVNAVLRRFIRERDSIITACEQDELYITNHPSWLVKKFRQAWPNRYKDLLVENDRQSPMSLRVNLAKTTRQSYYQKLAEAGMHGILSEQASSSITLSAPVEVSELPGFEQGLVSVQDEAAQLAPILLKLAPGLRVLDACSAPGGKTCHILESEPHLREVLAIDASKKRLDKVHENLARLGLEARLICADAAELATWWDKAPFDRILLDAPCSATGVIRRHPDIKHHRKWEDIPNFVALQRRLLEALWQGLKPGGLLVYATCSVLPEENEEQIEAFLHKHSDAKLEPVAINIYSASKIAIQLLPKKNGHDGFYYAVLRKERDKVYSSQPESAVF